MASAFWILEDGRAFARRWGVMAYMLDLIKQELKTLQGAEAFYDYLEPFVFREENGDEPNGHGGFIRLDESWMFNIDLRTFAPQNRKFFWDATQRALTKLKVHQEYKNEGIEFYFTVLLDMHKRVKRREDPMLLNHLLIVESPTFEKLGPGW